MIPAKAYVCKEHKLFVDMEHETAKFEEGAEQYLVDSMTALDSYRKTQAGIMLGMSELFTPDFSLADTILVNTKVNVNVPIKCYRNTFDRQIPGKYCAYILAANRIPSILVAPMYYTALRYKNDAYPLNLAQIPEAGQVLFMHVLFESAKLVPTVNEQLLAALQFSANFDTLVAHCTKVFGNFILTPPTSEQMLWALSVQVPWATLWENDQTKLFNKFKEFVTLHLQAVRDINLEEIDFSGVHVIHGSDKSTLDLVKLMMQAAPSFSVNGEHDGKMVNFCSTTWDQFKPKHIKDLLKYHGNGASIKLCSNFEFERELADNHAFMDESVTGYEAKVTILSASVDEPFEMPAPNRPDLVVLKFWKYVLRKLEDA